MSVDLIGGDWIPWIRPRSRQWRQPYEDTIEAAMTWAAAWDVAQATGKQAVCADASRRLRDRVRELEAHHARLLSHIESFDADRGQP